MECPEKTRSYMEALEEERCKIQVFRRELPLCLDMVTRAIEMCKQQLSGMTRSMEGTNGQISECLEQNSKEGPVLEEFIPIKRVSSPDRGDHDDDHDNGDEQNSHNYEDDEKKKSSWLKSVQLWNPNPEEIDPREDSPPAPHAEAESVLNGKAKRGAFQPSPITEKAAEKSNLSPGKAAAAPLAPAAATSVSSMAEKGGGDPGKREEKLGPRSKKKQRRSWSVDLHRLFVHALQQLGGPHVATPKQIRELMEVEDLTNDEIKSHLQKYRLHAKNSSRPNSRNVQAQPHQFLVVGGIWVPPSQPQYAAPEAAMLPGEAHIAHAPVAAPLPAEAAKTRVIWAAQQKAVGSGSEVFDAHGSSNSTTTTSTSTRTVTVC